jgi:type III secretion protein L
MALAFLITSQNLQLLSERKVLKEAEYAAMLEAADVIATAHREAQSIREQASLLAERDRERAYQEGLEQGRSEHADLMLDTAQNTQAQLDALRDAMTRLVTRAVTQIVAESDIGRVFECALGKVESLVRDEAFVSVRVAVAQEQALRRAFDTLRRQHGWGLKVVIQADPALAEGGCVMQTASGTIDLGVPAQLDAFSRAIRNDAVLAAPEAG